MSNYGKRARCATCGAISPIDPAKPIKHQRACPVRLVIAQEKYLAALKRYRECAA